jgi:ribosome-binding ATPase YchF (GTP1/OBG family)
MEIIVGELNAKDLQILEKTMEGIETGLKKKKTKELEADMATA